MKNMRGGNKNHNSTISDVIQGHAEDQLCSGSLRSQNTAQFKDVLSSPMTLLTITEDFRDTKEVVQK